MGNMLPPPPRMTHSVKNGRFASEPSVLFVLHLGAYEKGAERGSSELI